MAPYSERCSIRKKSYKTEEQLPKIKKKKIRIWELTVRYVSRLGWYMKVLVLVVSAFRNYQLLLLLILTTIPQQKILFIVRKMVSVMEMPWRYRALETIQLQFVVNGTDYHLHSMGTVTSWLLHSSLSIEVLGLDFLVDSAFLPRRIVM